MQKNREKTATPSNAQNSNNDNINGFSIYYYDDVVRASNSYNTVRNRAILQKGYN